MQAPVPRDGRPLHWRTGRYRIMYGPGRISSVPYTNGLRASPARHFTVNFERLFCSSTPAKLPYLLIAARNQPTPKLFLGNYFANTSRNVENILRIDDH